MASAIVEDRLLPPPRRSITRRVSKMKDISSIHRKAQPDGSLYTPVNKENIKAARSLLRKRKFISPVPEVNKKQKLDMWFLNFLKEKNFF